MVKEKVAVVKCKSYDEEEIGNSIKRIFAILDFNEKGKFLVKPNMLSARKPEEGVTTHPAIIKKIIENLKGEEITIGDSPANANKPIEKYWQECGYKEISDLTGAKLVKFSKSSFLKVKAAKEIEVPVWENLKEYRIINVAKLKTHTLTTLTISIKNLYGLIPGYMKSIIHSKFITPYEFSLFLVEFYKKIENYVSLNVVDAVVSMEGNGPSNGNLRKTNFLIAGKNAVAVDVVCCKITGVKIEDVPYLYIYKKLYGLPEIEIVGDKIELEKFKLPTTSTHKILSSPFFQPLVKLLSSNFTIQPVINKEKCKNCFSCYYVCPVKAISDSLKIDKKKCINCLCCFEVCPYKAIDLKKSLIAKLFT